MTSVQCAVLHKQYTFTSVCVDFALLSLGFVLKCICPFRKEDTSSALNLPSQNWKFSGLRYSIMQKQRLLQTSHSVTVRLEQRTRRGGIQTNLLLMKHKHMETWSTGVRQTIPDIRHGENQGLRILGNNKEN